MACTHNKIILASASPRRRELLARENFNFEIFPSSAEELSECGADPKALALENARLKAAQVADKFPHDVVLGADTIVVLGGKVFGKPKDLREARRMLGELQGRTHSVFTAVAIVKKDEGVCDLSADESRVAFKPMSEGQIADYLSKVNVLDKAGAYAAQEFGELIIESISGEFDNVMGLPCKLLKKRLDSLFGDCKIFAK